MTLDYIHVVRIWLFFYRVYIIKREVQRFSFFTFNPNNVLFKFWQSNGDGRF